MEASKHTSYVKKIHEKAKEEIEKRYKYYAEWANKHRKKVTFEPRDLVWVHLHKDRFPKKHKSMLMPQGDGPFRVLSKINDNAYKIDLPEHYCVSTSFNVANLTPFFGLEESESRMSPFQEGVDDEDIPTIHASSSINHPLSNIKDTNQGLLTRSRAKKLQQ